MTKKAAILGSKPFVDLIKEKFLSERKPDKELPSLTSFRQGLAIKDVVNEVDRLIENNTTRSKKLKIYLCHRHTDENLDSIGRHFDIGASGVCKAAGRFDKRINEIAGVRP